MEFKKYYIFTLKLIYSQSKLMLFLIGKCNYIICFYFKILIKLIDVIIDTQKKVYIHSSGTPDSFNVHLTESRI